MLLQNSLEAITSSSLMSIDSKNTSAYKYKQVFEDGGEIGVGRPRITPGLRTRGWAWWATHLISSHAGGARTSLHIRFPPPDYSTICSALNIRPNRTRWQMPESRAQTLARLLA